MTHKFKALGLALIAVAAIGAALASAAQAGVFKAEEYPARITGEQVAGTITGQEFTKHQFSTVVATWKCSTVKFQGELTEESSELTLTPTYEGCDWNGTLTTVNTNGCDYLFTAGETIEGSENKLNVSVHIKCEAGHEIEVILGECTIKLPSQTLSGITAENTLTAEPKMDVDLALDVKGFEYTVKNGSKCPNKPADGVYNNGSLKGVSTLTAENPSNSSKKYGVTVT